MFNSADECCVIQVSQLSTGESGGLMVEAGAGKPGMTSLEPRQRKVVKPIINLKPNHRGLAIMAPSFSSDLREFLTNTLIFAVHEPRDKQTLKSYMQAVDLVEQNHHPIIVVVIINGKGNLLRTDDDINIKEDIMAPLFPPIATHLADNPKIFLFVVVSDSSAECHFPLSFEPIGKNCIVGYIACNTFSGGILRVTRIIEHELASPSKSVQEIFTSIHHKVLPLATMTVLDRLKEPVYLHPRRSELTETHSGSPGIVTCIHTLHVMPQSPH